MWSAETLNSNVDEEIEALPRDMFARLGRFVKVIEGFGLQKLPRDAIKHLDGKL